MYDFRTFRFAHGSHSTRKDGTCYMECVAYLAGEPHSDHPVCASPVITELAIWLNDSYGEDDEARQRAFEPISPLRIIGTRASDEIEQQRAFMSADFAVRFVCPRILDKEQAATLRNLPVIDSVETARAAGYAARAARAAGYAAGYAAGCAAGYAASCAARAAAHYAARCAARCGAHGLNEIRAECVRLIDRMIRLTEPQEVVVEKALAAVEAKR